MQIRLLLLFLGVASYFSMIIVTGIGEDSIPTYTTPSIVIAIISFLSILAMVTTILGSALSGDVNWRYVDLLMRIACGLGLVSLSIVAYSYLFSYHIQSVCDYSKMYPNDPNAQWACPKLEVQTFVAPIFLMTLIIPIVLLGATYYAKPKAETVATSRSS